MTRSPGRVLVSFTRCDCPAIQAAYGETGGLGHLTVACREPGCRSVWYSPRHEPGNVSGLFMSGGGGGPDVVLPGERSQASVDGGLTSVSGSPVK